jgi:hypothetical protein
VAFLAVGLSVRASETFNTPEFREDAAASAGTGALTDLVDLVLWAVENIDLLLLGLGGLSAVRRDSDSELLVQGPRAESRHPTRR